MQKDFYSCFLFSFTGITVINPVSQISLKLLSLNQKTLWIFDIYMDIFLIYIWIFDYPESSPLF